MSQACPRCRHDLGEGEPVYQIYRGSHVCGECRKEIEGGVPHPSPFWRSAKPCANCGRPVLNMARRKEPEIVACGFHCRYAINKARYREKIARLERIASRPCAHCGKPLRAKAKRLDPLLVAL